MRPKCVCVYLSVFIFYCQLCQPYLETCEAIAIQFDRVTSSVMRMHRQIMCQFWVAFILNYDHSSMPYKTLVSESLNVFWAPFRCQDEWMIRFNFKSKLMSNKSDVPVSLVTLPTTWTSDIWFNFNQGDFHCLSELKLFDHCFWYSDSDTLLIFNLYTVYVVVLDL